MKTTYKQIASTQQVNQAISDIAAKILQDFPTKSPVFVALLRGAAPFSSKLMLEIVRQSPDYHPELDYMMVSTYGGGQKANEPHIVTDLAPTTAVTGRDVVIIDDVLDKGITADFVTSHLNARGARTVKLAVLGDKLTLRERDVTANYACFAFDDNWIVGMGMDDASAGNEGYRWLDEIWEVQA